jgi:hypothetical protein
VETASPATVAKALRDAINEETDIDRGTMYVC